MAFTEKELGQAQISNVSPTVLYTVPATTVSILKDMQISNTTGTAATITIWKVPNGGSPGDSNVLLKDYNVPAEDAKHWGGWQPFKDVGSTLQAQADTATAITITACGAEVT